MQINAAFHTGDRSCSLERIDPVHPGPGEVRIDLFQSFWREIEMVGARVAEPDDDGAAIRLVASGAIDSETLITDVRRLEGVGAAFTEPSGTPPP